MIRTRPTDPASAPFRVLLVGIVGAACSSPSPATERQPETTPASATRAEPAAQPGPDAPAHLERLANLDALRDTFNADAAKGRAILLLEPG